MMGLDVLDDETNRHPISHVKDELDCESLRDHRYMTLAMMGALAQAINTAIVVWVQHPTSPSKLVVHRESQVGYIVLTTCMPAPVRAAHSADVTPWIHAVRYTSLPMRYQSA